MNYYQSTVEQAEQPEDAASRYQYCITEERL